MKVMHCSKGYLIEFLLKIYLYLYFIYHMENLFKTMEYNVPSFLQHTSAHHTGYLLLKDPCQLFVKK